MSSEKMHNLGWRPKVPWKEGITKTSKIDDFYSDLGVITGGRERERERGKWVYSLVNEKLKRLNVTLEFYVKLAAF